MADFGQFRGFGDKLFQGQLPTKLGTIGSVIFGYDEDAQAFFDRVTTAGGTLSTTQKDAVNILVNDLKSNGLWSKMKAIYPMVGASAAACSQNLKSSSFTGTFSGGWTYANTGITGNGTNGYMETGLIPSNTLSQNSTHLSMYIRTNTDSINAMGVANDTNGTYELGLTPRRSNNVFVCINNTANSITSSTDSRAFHIGTRTASNQIRYYRNNNSANTLSNNSTGLSSFSFVIGAMRLGASLYNYYSGQIALVSIGDGLTDTEASNFYTAVQAFQTTLSRQV
jgi:hypothetical protein